MSLSWCTNRSSRFRMSLLNRPIGFLLFVIVRSAVLVTSIHVYAHGSGIGAVPLPRSGRVAARVAGGYMAEQFEPGKKSMRAETQSLVEEIKQSVRLLRRHL